MSFHPKKRATAPTFYQFARALLHPQYRPDLHLVIDDADATALIGNLDWALNYYYGWVDYDGWTDSPSITPSLHRCDRSRQPRYSPLRFCGTECADS